MVDQQFVAVPVPADLVADVFQFVLDRTRVRTDGSHTKPAAGVLPPEWPPEELAEFFWEASQNPRAIMELLAGRPGERLTTEDFARAIGKGDDPKGTWSVAGVLGAIRKKAKRKNGRDWPFDCVHDRESETYYYSMPAAYASVITSEAERLRSAIAAASPAKQG
jgi:hypothetical protein